MAIHTHALYVDKPQVIVILDDLHGLFVSAGHGVVIPAGHLCLYRGGVALVCLVLVVVRFAGKKMVVVKSTQFLTLEYQPVNLGSKCLLYISCWSLISITKKKKLKN